MTENTTPEQRDPSEIPVIWISFCPDLGIYHMHREEGDEVADQKFTREELEIMVDGMVKAGEVVAIQQLVELCAWARLFAHKWYVLYVAGNFRIFNAVPPEKVEQEDGEFMKQFFADWKKDHPEGTQLPTVAPFRTRT